MPSQKVINSFTSEDEDIPPLTRLTMVFHQDFGLMGIDPIHAGSEFVGRFSEEESEVFQASVIKLLEEYPGRNQKGLRNAWFRIGAQWWGKGYDLRQALMIWADVGA